jgi:predicted phage terminase large subunit-like protein
MNAVAKAVIPAQRQDEISPQSQALKVYTEVTAEYCRRDLRQFVRYVWPLVDPKPFVSAWHIDAICEHLAYLYLGDIRNLMINIPPRMTKSSIVSVAFMAWVWADSPHTQFLCASYDQDLAELDAAKARRIIESSWYRDRYTDVSLLQDENRVGRFTNTKGGFRQTIAVNTKTTGLGGDIKILDDPHNALQVEQQAARKRVTNWHDNAWRSRNNDPNTVRNVYVGQRTHDADVFGMILGREPERWVHLNLPMEYEPDRKCITYLTDAKGKRGKKIFEDPRTAPGALLCPDRYGPEAASYDKETLPTRTWNGQYQQRPEGAGGIIMKRNWWRKWGWPEWHPEYGKTERPLPEVIEVIQCYDTNFEDDEQEKGSYCVRTTWILFRYMEEMKPGSKSPNKKRGEDGRMSAMLVERKRWRPSFGDMRDDALESANTWLPDKILIEKKASGHSLIHELRRRKTKDGNSLPVRGVKVAVDLVYRAYTTSLPLEKGAIWYYDRAWAKDVIEECAKFPDVEHDDQVSSVTIALGYMRRFMELKLNDEEDEEDGDLDLFAQPKLNRKGYYG